MLRARRTTLEAQDAVHWRAHVLTWLSGLIAAAYVFVLLLVCTLVVADNPHRSEAIGTFLRGLSALDYAIAAIASAAVAVALQLRPPVWWRPVARPTGVHEPDGPQGHVVDAVAELSLAAGVSPPPVLVFDSSVINACLVDADRPTLVFTSAACRLPTEQLHALVAHEIASAQSPAVRAVLRSRTALQRLWRVLQAAYAVAVVGSLASIVTDRTALGGALLGGFAILTLVAAPVLVIAMTLAVRDAGQAEVVADVEALRLHQSPDAFVSLGLDVVEAPDIVRSPFRAAVWFDRHVESESTFDPGLLGARGSLLARIALANEAAEGGSEQNRQRIRALLDVEAMRAEVRQPVGLLAVRAAVWVSFLGAVMLAFAGAANRPGLLDLAAVVGVIAVVAFVVRRARLRSWTRRRADVMAQIEYVTRRCANCEGTGRARWWDGGTVTGCPRCGGTGTPPGRRVAASVPRHRRYSPRA